MQRNWLNSWPCRVKYISIKFILIYLKPKKLFPDYLIFRQLHFACFSTPYCSFLMFFISSTKSFFSKHNQTTRFEKQNYVDLMVLICQIGWQSCRQTFVNYIYRVFPGNWKKLTTGQEASSEPKQWDRWQIFNCVDS